MNPVIIIPSYWSGRKYDPPVEAIISSYDHMTPINAEGELPRCLKSLQTVRGICRIVITVVSEPSVENEAASRVRQIADQFPNLNILVVGYQGMERIHERLEQLGHADFKEAVTLSGYGSVRNAGLLVAAILGHTEVVFIDDDEVITDPDFLEKALYGLGKLTKRGIPVLAKTGFYLDRRGSWEAKEDNQWYNVAWKLGESFNKWIRPVMEGARLSPANSACGGCLAIHIEGFKRVAFDPWITRGEDLDYMLNMRMYGFDVWFDNTWSLRHLPPETVSEALRFRQDIYRWTYEHRKLEYLRSQIDLLPINPKDLEPYPGPFLESSITTRMFFTAILRSIARPEKQGYFQVARKAHKEADAYAQKNCSRYFRFQYRWPELISSLENDAVLQEQIAGANQPVHRGFTGQFKEISSEMLEEEVIGNAEDIARRWASGDVSGRTQARRSSRQANQKDFSSRFKRIQGEDAGREDLEE